MNCSYKNILTAIVLGGILAACAEDTSSVGGGHDVTEPANGREMIAFTQENGGMTHASLTRAGFDSNTKIVLRIKAEGGSPTRYSQAVATAGEKITGDALASDDHKTQFGLDREHSHVAYNDGQARYWDDAFGRASLLTVYAVAVPNKNSTDIATRTDGQAVISDDILNQTGTSVDVNSNKNWYTISSEENTKIKWMVSTKQTSTTLVDEDLAYSNNIREGVTGANMKGRYHQEYSNSQWNPSMQPGRLSWQPQTDGSTVGKFDQGHLVFQHALTKIEIHLMEGAGFDALSATDFDWTSKPSGHEQNITLTGFNTSGNLDLSKTLSDANLWTGQTSSDIQQLDESVEGTYTKTRKLTGYVVPGTALDGVNDKLIKFEIDHTEYAVTGEQIAEAIKANDNTKTSEAAKTLAGKHYIIKLKIGKKEINDVTAAILDWETVNSTEIEADNTLCTFEFEDRGTQVSTDLFNIYRKGITIDQVIQNSTEANYVWETGYESTPATKTWVADETPATGGHWKTNWYWPDNKTYYHFRAAGINASGSVNISTDSNGDYFTIASGEINGTTYKDYLWGAPFMDVAADYKFKYDATTNGFSLNEDGTKQISKAIAATTSQIKMLLFHMMSKINVTVKTTTDAGKVKLQDDAGDTDDKKYTKVEILNFLPTGKVLMGTGLVTADGTRKAEAMGNRAYTDEASDKSTAAQVTFSYGIVPQALKWTEDPAGTIGMRITTPDGNVYTISDLSKYAGTVGETNLKNPYTETSTGSGKYTINAWYPHYQYTYNVTITKTGIANITAAVLPWEEVVTDLGTINLENN